MANPYHRAPHQGGAGFGVFESPHAALLIDFDNVTMGMRSDLSKELKTLLASDVIKGKVSVQRAYADWRRYPQYIVPLSEASVDLIFAPAYGNSKKNATDIRMAIDALELVFVRPEIGTFILLTGDSDFSSLVLKLKEYGKYVIGVGIQESTSDILVQNCDEYYSYTSLTGLRKTTEAAGRSQDPWVLLKEAVKRMVERDDVMRSDRLKQVMQEMDPTFDEGGHGFSRFSKFLAEASSRGLVRLHKMENGQYEVGPPRAGRGRKEEGDEPEPRRERGRGRGEGRDREARDPSSRDEVAEAQPPRESAAERPAGDDPLKAGYALMVRALEELRGAGKDAVRDSDVKRKMLEIEGGFDETELGFPKFSKFLSQAEEHGVVRLVRNEAGNFEVTLEGAGESPRGRRGGRRRGGAERHERDSPSLFESFGDASGSAVAEPPADVAPAGEGAPAPEPRPERRPEPKPEPKPEPRASVVEINPAQLGDQGLRLGPRRGSTRRRGDEDTPVFLPGQAVAAPAFTPSSERIPEPRAPVFEETPGPSAGTPSADGPLDATALGLPTEPAAIVRYLTHRYRGVGEKTAELLVEQFGADLFRVLRDDPEAISAAVTPKRAEQVLEAWKIDFERRQGRRAGGVPDAPEGRSGDRGRRGSRRRGPRGRSES
ncbi:MAG: NYN domain-containing protein [Longimicrobiales bacterium]|nr:NYN domain-containing protein [Longimicrobiales bacterium]